MARPAAPEDGAGSAQQPGSQPTFFGTVCAALAGRWLAVIAAGLVTASAGVWLGWRMGKPMYLSEGLVRIAYTAPPVLRETDQSGIPVEIYQALLQSLQALISSRPQIEAALREQTWAATGRGTSKEAVESFASNLVVEHKASADYLRITFTDRDPAVAGAAVTSVVNQFARTYRGKDEQFQQQRLSALAERQQELQARLADVRNQAALVNGGAGVADSDHLHEAAVREVSRLEGILSDIRLAEALAPGTGGGTVDPQQIAGVDTVMRGYIAERDRLRDELLQLRLAGYGEGHPLMQRRISAMEVVSARIADYAKQYRGTPGVGANAKVGTGAPGGTQEGLNARRGQSLESLRAEEASVGALYEKAKKEMVTLGAKRAQTQKLMSEADTMEKDLYEVTRRIDDLRLEAAGGGRLSVVSAGETPTKPFRDRRVPAMSLGGALGGILPAALVVLFELAGKRYRRFGRAETDWRAHARLLGVLPMLKEMSNAIGADSVDAAHCMHQIRVVLQVSKPADRGASYLITSATAGEGKTSVTAALALAFAVSGSRTLIIDCDLVSRRMTRGFGMDSGPGVFEALADGTLQGRIRQTQRRGLWIVPTGDTDQQGASTLSPSSIRRLLVEAEREFDVVLIDAGPILGSIEASAVAARVDGVILVIARKQARLLVERAVRQLGSIRARLTGFIFNRAETGDFQRSAYSYSYSASSRSPGAAARGGLPVVYRPKEPRLGPLFHSVAASSAPDAGAADELQA